MRIIEILDDQEKVISLNTAKRLVEEKINNETKEFLYIVKYEGKIISFSGDYYKFAWKKIGYLSAALTNKFGKELSEALVDNGVIEIIKLRV
jgi:predicted ribosome-associated RNA-binding protein Tma20